MLLEKSGTLKNIYKWWDIDNGLQLDDDNKRQQYAYDEIKATYNCAIFIMLFATSRGCHVELGSALASSYQNPEKQVYFFCENKDMPLQTFYLHPNVIRRHGDIESLAKEIVQQSKEEKRNE